MSYVVGALQNSNYDDDDEVATNSLSEQLSVKQ